MNREEAVIITQGVLLQTTPVRPDQARHVAERIIDTLTEPTYGTVTINTEE